MAEKKETGTWMPSLKWFCKTFIIIISCLVIIFFTLNFLLKSYMRDIPMEITPWLDNSQQQTDSVKNQEINKEQNK